MSDEIPQGYEFEPSPSAFLNHIGRVYQKRETPANGVQEFWSALKIEDHHVNSWGLCHGAVMTAMAEVGTSSPAWDPDGPPVVATELSMQFIAAPRLGELIEVCGLVTKRTRSLVFTRAEAFVDGKTVFFATSVQKILSAAK